MSSFGQDPTIFTWSSPMELRFVWEDANSKRFPFPILDLDVGMVRRTAALQNTPKNTATKDQTPQQQPSPQAQQQGLKVLQQQGLNVPHQQQAPHTPQPRGPLLPFQGPSSQQGAQQPPLPSQAPPSQEGSQHPPLVPQQPQLESHLPDPQVNLMLDKLFHADSATLLGNSNTPFFGCTEDVDAPIFQEASELYCHKPLHEFQEEHAVPSLSFDTDGSTRDEDESADAVADSYDMEDDEEMDPVVSLSRDSQDSDTMLDSLDSLDEGDDGDQATADGLRWAAIKLKASKSPIMDALVYCALNGWGIKLIKDVGDDIQFQVTDFRKYYKFSGRICAKQNPTEDQASRIKALKRWFPDFPTKRERGKIEGQFFISVTKGTKKDNKPKKMRDIIERNRRLLGIRKDRTNKN